VEWTVMELAETLMFAGVIRRYIVGKPEEEKSERFPRNEVKTGFLDFAGPRSRCGRVTMGLRGWFHLFESVYDRGMKFVFEG
jgi:hypothetical protein